mmetsp:Transcript_11914/g.25792  ORF Transcript_11914/g.25792 Transcript_11914/m.25792 type:complete len:604 (-) Transcript_11914:283-2094(-)
MYMYVSTEIQQPNPTMTSVAIEPTAPSIDLPTISAEAPKSTVPTSTRKTKTKTATPLQKQFKNQIVSPNRANAAVALSALFRSGPNPSDAIADSSADGKRSNGSGSTSTTAKIPQSTSADTAASSSQQEKFKNQAPASRSDPMPSYTAYHPYAYGTAPYGPGTAVSNPISSKKDGPAADRGMDFIVQATQAVSPFKQGYHVTPSPHQNQTRPMQQPCYLPPSHAYSYPYQQGAAGPSPLPPKRGYVAPLLVPSGAAAKNGGKSKGSRPAKKQKVKNGEGSKDTSYDRAEKSLGLLAKKFMDTFASKPVAPLEGPPEEGSTLSIDDAADALDVERRRIYDIINILESVKVVTRAKKNTYMWHGGDNLPLFFARLQQESFRLHADEAKKNGIITEDTYIRQSSFPDGAADEKKEKSLSKISTNFLRIFLLGNETMGLTEVSDRILGTRSTGVNSKSDDETTEAAKKAAKQMKTKIRRLYDVANVLQSIGIVEKINSGSSYTQGNTRPSFKWVFHVAPKEMPELLARHDKDLLLGDNISAEALVAAPSQKDASITMSAKKMLANINQSGAIDDSVEERAVIPSTCRVVSTESNDSVVGPSTSSEYL